MRFTIFDAFGYVYDVCGNIWTAQSIARQIGGYAIDDEGNMI